MTIQLYLNLEKLQEINLILNQFAKLSYIGQSQKKQVSFESQQQQKGIIKYKKMQLQEEQEENKEEYEEEQELEEELQKKENLKNKDNQQTFLKKPEDIYFLDDPEIITIRKRREERRIRSELREIGKKKSSNNNKENEKDCYIDQYERHEKLDCVFAGYRI
ncbi:hypothetical protein IMG5_073250 [Ichthyophthirius multifiliis]|uniref:Uncharacterized protein n=1 Tax=Ichthyophthirius multifiliis TaxID=5932 RepID=G0QPZ4_ICHMU|nr:hypothetical protein IMG5_073250 [Ichthyophthirius multifiliis]EGR32709.1 hypothetical protein IMG5_073250 [Ichthyophthirius multifiliis]|eukprot:XP_004036695.1 hypothetical protein IMG5_073250 [Ichthyophthirius multifiliis]